MNFKVEAFRVDRVVCLGLPEPYISTPHMTVCMVNVFVNTLYIVYTPYIHTYVWFWPTLCMLCDVDCQVMYHSRGHCTYTHTHIHTTQPKGTGQWATLDDLDTRHKLQLCAS